MQSEDTTVDNRILTVLEEVVKVKKIAMELMMRMMRLTR